MKKLMAVFATIGVVASAQAEELVNVAYGKYRILGQVVVPNQPSGGQTYLVTYNPAMVIMIGSNDAAAVHRISTGHLKSCRRVEPEKVKALQQEAVKDSAIVSQLEMTKAAGLVLTETQQNELDFLKTLIESANESADKPMYACEVQPMTNK